MRKWFATVLVLALLFAPVIGAARPLVLEPFSAPEHCSADSGCDVAIAGRRAGTMWARGAVLAGAPSAVASWVTCARSDGATASRFRVARRSPRALLSARFHRKLAAPDRGVTEPPFVL